MAILLVFVAHLLEGTYPHDRKLFEALPHGGGGGFIGVQLFFVLSGYLITSILARELTEKGAISYKRFYIRRARRLLPALVTVCVAYAAYALVVASPEQRAGAFGSIARALTYTTNLGFLWRGVPDTRWLQHCWSLAVEEQFYLLWPPVLALAFGLRRVGGARLAITGVIVTVLLRLVGRLEPLSYEVLRWDALMLGAFLALAKPRLPITAGWVGAAILAYYAIRRTGGYTTWDYLLSAAGSALFIDLALRTELMKNAILGYFGKISYGLYLWHVLLMRLGTSGWVAGPASVLVADLSYRYLEARFLHAPRESRSPALAIERLG